MEGKPLPYVLCLDGHRVRSEGERFIDDYLAVHAAEFGRHGYEQSVYTRRGRRLIAHPDWTLYDRGMIIEYFGMIHQTKKYDDEMVDKLHQYWKNGYGHINLYPADINSGEFDYRFRKLLGETTENKKRWRYKY